MNPASKVPADRVRLANRARTPAAGKLVLYWMTANRRLDWNFALQRAVDWSIELGRPLVILEGLRVDYPWASARFHRFVMDGMAEKHAELSASPATYLAYVEPTTGAGRGLFAKLAEDACVVVGDDCPAFFMPAMLAAAAEQIETRFELIDANGLLPLAAADRDYPTAHGFRRFLQRELPTHLEQLPEPHPLARLDTPATDGGAIEKTIAPWPMASASELEGIALLAGLPVDHGVRATAVRGGSREARRRLTEFVAQQLPHYGARRDQPDDESGSLLSPYLHFGQISAHEIFATIAAEELWSPVSVATSATGARRGWWGMSAGSEAFLDQLVTWRELGYNFSHQRPDYREYASLPPWALATLDEHRDDERPYRYTIDQLEGAATHDGLWNAAQIQLATEGRIHNYLRMLWGKKVLEWSASPEEALAAMVELNNKYALDGRDPNSYSGIFWVLGRFDRPWGPERRIFGKVRYMSSENTARKLRVKEYIRTYAGDRERKSA